MTHKNDFIPLSTEAKFAQSVLIRRHHGQEAGWTENGRNAAEKMDRSSVEQKIRIDETKPSQASPFVHAALKQIL